MDEIRSALITPLIIHAIIFPAVLSFMAFSELTGKFQSKGLKPIRDKFDKKYPGLNRKLSLAVLTLFAIGNIFILRPYVLDFMHPQTMVATGRATTVSTHRSLLFSRVTLGDGQTYIIWLGTARIAEGTVYEIFYTPHSRTVIRIMEVDED